MIQRFRCSVFTILVLAVFGVSSASNLAPPSTASGEGSVTFGKDGHSVGYFTFEVVGKPKASGSLLFAAEQPHLYPDVIVRLSAIETAVFDGRTVELSGAAMLHDDPVTARVSVFDGAGTTKLDRFSITCTNEQGEVVFEADGDVTIGGVVVGGKD